MTSRPWARHDVFPSWRFALEESAIKAVRHEGGQVRKDEGQIHERIN